MPRNINKTTPVKKGSSKERATEKIEDDSDSSHTSETPNVQQNSVVPRNTPAPQNNEVAIPAFEINLDEVPNYEKQKVSAVSTINLLKVLVSRGNNPDNPNPVVSIGAEKMLKQLNRIPFRPRGQPRFLHGHSQGRGRGRGRRNFQQRNEDDSSIDNEDSPRRRNNRGQGFRGANRYNYQANNYNQANNYDE